MTTSVRNRRRKFNLTQNLSSVTRNAQALPSPSTTTGAGDATTASSSTDFPKQLHVIYDDLSSLSEAASVRVCTVELAEEAAKQAASTAVDRKLPGAAASCEGSSTTAATAPGSSSCAMPPQCSTSSGRPKPPVSRLDSSYIHVDDVKKDVETVLAQVKKTQEEVDIGSPIIS